MSFKAPPVNTTITVPRIKDGDEAFRYDAYHDVLPIYHRSANIITYYLSGVTRSVDNRSEAPCDSMI